MDDSVRRAMARWPDVPAVYGWLRLDTTGRWLVRGEPVLHQGLIEFIGRNYDCDEHGRWYFQNGPQRVYVTLDYTPWVLHVDSGGHLRTHTERAVSSVQEALVVDDGELLLSTDAGVGLVAADSLPAATEYLLDGQGMPVDADTLAGAIENGRAGEHTGIRFAYPDAPLIPIARADVADRFGFVAAPQAPAAA